MFYELYTKRMSAEAAEEIAKATYEKVKNEYELGKGHLSNEDDKNLREWIYGGIHEGAEILKIITDFLPAGKAAKVLKTIKESWNNKGDYSKSVTTQTSNMCYFAKKVLNKRFLPNRKNRWNPPVCTDERFRYVEVECGHCFECRIVTGKQKLRTTKRNTSCSVFYRNSISTKI